MTFRGIQIGRSAPGKVTFTDKTNDVSHFPLKVPSRSSITYFLSPHCSWMQLFSSVDSGRDSQWLTSLDLRSPWTAELCTSPKRVRLRWVRSTCGLVFSQLFSQWVWHSDSVACFIQQKLLYFKRQTFVHVTVNYVYGFSFNKMSNAFAHKLLLMTVIVRDIIVRT